MFAKNRLNGGEKASSLNPNHHSERLVYVRYKDHVLFRNSDPKLYSNSNIRETVGWQIHETDEVLFLTHDRSVQPLSNEVCETGLIILKSEILEIRIIRKLY